MVIGTRSAATTMTLGARATTTLGARSSARSTRAVIGNRSRVARAASGTARAEPRRWTPSAAAATRTTRTTREKRGTTTRPRAASEEPTTKSESVTTAQSGEITSEAKQNRDVAIVAACLGVSCAFGAGIGAVEGADKASEYFAGYLLEQSLSVDNLFVFVLLFEYFKVPPERQTRVLNYGIVGALVMRAVMVGAGVELIENFQPILLVFAGILIFSSYKLLAEGEEEEEDMGDNAIVKFVGNFLEVSEDYDGDNFFTVQNGVKMATPLLLVLAVVEISDVVFAVDSIPAVFGVTKDPFIVYTSNLFAILSLRQLYTLISKAVGELKYLQTAVALVLGFIGAKMIVEYAGVEIPTEASLAVVVTMLGGGVGASLMLPSEDEEGEE